MAVLIGTKDKVLEKILSETAAGCYSLFSQKEAPPSAAAVIKATHSKRCNSAMSDYSLFPQKEAPSAAAEIKATHSKLKRSESAMTALFVPDDDDLTADEPTRTAWVRGEIHSYSHWKGIPVSGSCSTPHPRKQDKPLLDRMTLVYSEYSLAMKTFGRVPVKRRGIKVDFSQLLPPGWEEPLPPRPPRYSNIRASKGPRPTARIAVPKSPITLQVKIDSPVTQQVETKLDLEVSATQQYRVDRRDALKILFTYMYGTGYAGRLKSAFDAVIAKRCIAAKKICKWIRKKSNEARVRAFFHNMRWPLYFIVNIRAFRKRNAVKKLTSFFREWPRVSMAVKMQVAMLRLRRAQLCCKKFVSVCKARITALLMFWEKIEVRFRGVLQRTAKLEANRVKNDALKRLMEREKERKGHHNILTLWAEQKQAVTMLLAHCDVVQSTFRKNFEHSSALIHESQQGDFPVNVSPTAEKQTVEVKRKELESLSRAERESLIVKHMKEKRRLHIEHIRLAKQEQAARKVTAVSTEQCKAFLSARTKAEISSALDDINKQLFVAEYVSDEPNRALFLCFTDKTLGLSWREIVQMTVKSDIQRKS